jgi:Predicted xylanase/chitin deacetylase
MRIFYKRRRLNFHRIRFIVLLCSAMAIGIIISPKVYLVYGIIKIKSAEVYSNLLLQRSSEPEQNESMLPIDTSAVENSKDKPIYKVDKMMKKARQYATVSDISKWQPTETAAADYVVPFENINQDDGKKVIFLTFDDGPSKKYTPEVLDILQKYNIHATFFVIGKNAENYPEIIKREAEEGHSLGNHSYTHVYKDIYSSKESFVAEVEKTNQVLKSILGNDHSFRLFRFPGGSFGSDRQPMRDIIKENGYQYVDWNALSGDAGGENTVEGCINSAKKTASGKDKIILLMHDFKKVTLQSLPAIIEYFQTNKYEFKTMQ